MAPPSLADAADRPGAQFDGFIRKSEIELRMQRHGDGAPIFLFLHGASGSNGWVPFFEIVSAKGQLWVPDHPGFGSSSDVPWMKSISDLAFFYLDLIEELSLDNVHVIGHGMGGWIGVEMAIRDRSRLSSLTLCAPAGLRKQGVSIGDNFLWTPEEQVQKLYHDKTVAEAAARNVSEGDWHTVAAKNQRAAAKYGWEPRWFNPQLEYWLHRVKIPTQLVWGEFDNMFPVALAEKWQAHLPQAKLTVLPAGHLPHIELPEETSALVHRFIEGVR